MSCKSVSQCFANMLLKYCLPSEMQVCCMSCVWVYMLTWTQLLNFGFADMVTVGQAHNENLIFPWLSELKKCIYGESHALRNDRVACDMEALTFMPVQTLLQTKKWAVTLNCSVRQILFLLEELNNNSCAVHTSSRMIIHMREILQGATGTYDPAVLLEGSVYYTILPFLNSKKHGYTSLSTVCFSAHCTSC